MTTKKTRTMKVCEQSGYKYRPTPAIQLKGQWLKEFGFEAQTPIKVECEDGRLIITKADPSDTAADKEETGFPQPSGTPLPCVAEKKRHYGRKVTYGGKQI